MKDLLFGSTPMTARYSEHSRSRDRIKNRTIGERRRKKGKLTLSITASSSGFALFRVEILQRKTRGSAPPRQLRFSSFPSSELTLYSCAVKVTHSPSTSLDHRASWLVGAKEDECLSQGGGERWAWAWSRRERTAKAREGEDPSEEVSRRKGLSTAAAVPPCRGGVGWSWSTGVSGRRVVSPGVA